MPRLRDIMTTDVVTVSPELTIGDAMALLATRHVSGAPVASRKKVVGVGSLTDLAEAVSLAITGCAWSAPAATYWSNQSRASSAMFASAPGVSKRCVASGTIEPLDAPESIE